MNPSDDYAFWMIVYENWTEDEITSMGVWAEEMEYLIRVQNEARTYRNDSSQD